MTAEAGKTDLVRILTVVFGIGLTSIIGWGTSFSAIAILGTIIGKDLGLSREVIFGGMTVMLVTSGLVAPRCGRLVDREGPRKVMTFGSALCAVSLALMARADGAISFWVAWGLFGVAVPLAMSNAAVTAIAQVAGPHARRAITGLTILAGTTSAIFLPLTAWIEARYGWRLTLALFAIAHLVICLPVHLFVLPSRSAASPSGLGTESGAKSDATWDGVLPEAARSRAFWLIVAWSCFEGMLVWGFNLQAVDLLRGLGLAQETAIAVWMLSAGSQAVSRIADFLYASRIPVMSTALVSAALAPVGFAVFLTLGVGVPGASLMAICYGLGHGLFVVARNVLPLRLFGLRTLGETMGRMSRPQSIVNAFAPIVFAAILARYGAYPALLFTAFCGVASFVAVVLLALMLKRAGQ
jgi:MFS family permease